MQRPQNHSRKPIVLSTLLLGGMWSPTGVAKKPQFLQEYERTTFHKLLKECAEEIKLQEPILTNSGKITQDGQVTQVAKTYIPNLDEEKEFYTRVKNEGRYTPAFFESLPTTNAKVVKEFLVDMSILAKLSYERRNDLTQTFFSKLGIQIEPFWEREEGSDEIDTTLGIGGYALKVNEVMFITTHGSEYLRDWGLNTKCFKTVLSAQHPEAAVHRGFAERSQKYMPSLLYALNKLEITTDTHFVFTGHSLGGSLSQIMAVHLHDFLKCSYKEWGRSDTFLQTILDKIHIATFASPRPGNKGFAALVNQFRNVFHVYQKGDLLQASLTISMGFYPSEKEIRLAPNFKHDTTLKRKTKNHQMDIYISLLKNLKESTIPFHLPQKDRYFWIKEAIGDAVEEMREGLHCALGNIGIYRSEGPAPWYIDFVELYKGSLFLSVTDVPNTTLLTVSFTPPPIPTWWEKILQYTSL